MVVVSAKGEVVAVVSDAVAAVSELFLQATNVRAKIANVAAAKLDTNFFIDIFLYLLILK